MNTIRQILNKVAEMHPYKVLGQHDTYSKYNEGWEDAIDQLEQELEQFGVVDWMPVDVDEPYIVITRQDYWKLHNGTMTLQQFLDKYKPTQRDLP